MGKNLNLTKHHSKGKYNIPATIVLFAAFLMLFGCKSRESSTELSSMKEILTRLDNIEHKLTELEVKVNGFQSSLSKIDEDKRALKKQTEMLAQDMQRLSKKIGRGKAKKAKHPIHKGKAVSTAKGKYHIVQAGETLYAISRKYSITVDELCRLNNLKKGQTIYPKQKILITP